MELNICHLYPDILNLYGDQGNIICMKKRLERRGIKANITELSIGENANFSDFDLFFIGGGQDFEQEILLADLENGKSAEIKSAVADEKVFLAICGGYQMLGNYYLTHDGKQCDFIGALDLHTVGEKDRLIGNMMFELTEENGGGMVVGFENHSGRTYLDGDVMPLGTIIRGHGNNGHDDSEGARFKNTFGSYSHGPILPKNPNFADFLLKTALNRRYGDIILDELADIFEQKAHSYMEKRLSI